MRNLLYVAILLSLPACASENAHSQNMSSQVDLWVEASNTTVGGQVDSNVCDAGYVPSCTTVLGNSSCVCEGRVQLEERYRQAPGQRGSNRHRR